MKLTQMHYVCSPFTAKGIGSKRLKRNLETMRERLVTEAIGKLHDQFPFAFIGPITQSYQTAKFTKSKTGAFDSWRLIDLTFVDRSDEVWLLNLPGWEESTGVKEEIEYARKKKKPIKVIEWTSLRNEKIRVRKFTEEDYKRLQLENNA